MIATPRRVSAIQHLGIASVIRPGGYSDEAIRQFLHEIGARRSERDDGAEEWWYLTSRQQERVTRTRPGRTDELPLFEGDEQRSEVQVERQALGNHQG